MTIGKFFSITFLQAALLIVLKVVFFRVFDYHNFFLVVLFECAVVVVAVSLVRRLGVINFLEAMFVAGFWVIMDLLLDLFITLPISGVSIFRTGALWLGYLILALFVFAMHKKRHIHIRKEQAAHHGHH